MTASTSRRRDSGSIAGSCDHRSMSTSTEKGLTSKGHEKSDRPTVSSHGHSFTVSDTVDHVPTVVA